MNKRAIIFILAVLLVLPVTGSAFTLDDAVMSYVNYLKGRISTLEAENAELKKSCSTEKIEKTGTYTVTKRVKKEIKHSATVEVTTDEKIHFNIGGDFDETVLHVSSPNGEMIANVKITYPRVFDMGTHGNGKYFYQLKSTKDGVKDTLSGQFTI